MTLPIVIYFLITRILSITLIFYYWKSHTPVDATPERKDQNAQEIVAQSLAALFVLEPVTLLFLIMLAIGIPLVTLSYFVSKLL